MFRCPGCGESHVISVAPGRWTWNNAPMRPTFRPSVLVTGLQGVLDTDGKWTGEWRRDANGKPLPLRCHSFVTDGRIQFLSDSTHALAGMTVDLPDWTED